MDPFRWCIAVGPVAVYLVVLGVLNLFKRPVVVSGPRDTAMLGLAVAGFVVVGPIELFLPVASTIAFGPLIWIFLTGLYGLGLVLTILLVRPRIVVYNISGNELRPVLADLAMELDPQARWAGDCLVLPGLGVQLYLECVGRLRNVSLISAGRRQNHVGWHRLEVALGTALRQVEVARNRRGFSLLAAGTLLAALVLATIARNPQAATQSLVDLVRF